MEEVERLCPGLKDFILEQPLTCSLLCVLKSVQRIGSKGRRAGGATPKYEEKLRAHHFKTHHFGMSITEDWKRGENSRSRKRGFLVSGAIKAPSWDCHQWSWGRGWTLVEESSPEADPTPETVAQAVTLPSTAEPDLPKITRSLPDAYTLLPFPY